MITRLREDGGRVLVFGHGHFSRVLAARWTGLTTEDARHLMLSTASLSIVGYEHTLDDPAIVLWNDDHHASPVRESISYLELESNERSSKRAVKGPPCESPGRRKWCGVETGFTRTGVSGSSWVSMLLVNSLDLMMTMDGRKQFNPLEGAGTRPGSPRFVSRRMDVGPTGCPARIRSVRSILPPLAGDRLYLYSDGVTEAMDPSGEMFGDARLLEAIGRARSVSLQESVAALVGEIERWRGTASAQDDISIVAVEVSVASGPGEPDVDPLRTRMISRERNESIPVGRSAPGGALR